jgi:hypothetical protein
LLSLLFQPFQSLHLSVFDPFKQLSYSVLAAIGLLVLRVLVIPERERGLWDVCDVLHGGCGLHGCWRLVHNQRLLHAVVNTLRLDLAL